MAKRKSSFGLWLVLAALLLIGSQIARTPDNSPSGGVARPAAEVSVGGQNTSSSNSAVIETRYVTATALNVRQEPSTSANVIASLAKGAALSVVDRRNGWLMVRLSSVQHGWVPEQYTSHSRPQTTFIPPAPLSQPTQNAAGQSCNPRRTCGQIGSCRAAQWYLKNCDWGWRLDRDNDGRACEALC